MRGFEKFTQADADRLQRRGGARLPGAPTTSQAPAKRSKWNNVRTQAEGIWFQSAWEAQYWLMLRNQEANGEITELERQVEYDLRCPDEKNPSMSHIVAFYKCDYRYRDAQGVQHVVDAKGGPVTKEFRLKEKWMWLQHGIEIELVRK